MSVFNRVPVHRPGRSVFDLSYQKQFDCDFGELIPICCEEMVPGDTFKIGNEIVVRTHPLNSPVLGEMNGYVHYYFVPTRLIFDGWEDFITGGVDGNDATILPRFNGTGSESATQKYGPHSLYDYFGFPVIKDAQNSYSMPGAGTIPSNPGYLFRPLSFPWRCYNICWNEFYRDETFQTEVDLDQPLVLHRNWQKDYFTSALPWQQRGTSPALPLEGYGSAVWSDSVYGDVLVSNTLSPGLNTNVVRGAGPGTITNEEQKVYYGTGRNSSMDGYKANSVIPKSNMNANTIDMSNVGTFDVSQLRLAFQVQRWMERNALCGVRYTEFLHAHFGVSPRDDRLQRPEYLGGTTSPILISEVVQTSESGTTPQGTLKGKGFTADRSYVATYTAKEFGYLIGFFSIMPKAGYFQGVDPKWLRSSRYDFYFSEFAHLSEQVVTEEMLFAQPETQTTTIGDKVVGNDYKFGFQARYNEMRHNHDMFCGDLRPNAALGYWNVGRYFDTPPLLNSDFITLNAENDHLKRIFAVQNTKGFIVNFANRITAIRPIPKYGEPGLIDHN